MLKMFIYRFKKKRKKKNKQVPDVLSILVFTCYEMLKLSPGTCLNQEYN